jgi:aryl-alcohol dehydrogenase-like predicted oxidoreductase
MIRKPLGIAGMQITPIGVGAWAMGGGGWAYAWGPQDDRESIKAIRAAIDAGVNWIDTAPVYGLGHSEEVVARALEGVSPRPYVFTKCGMIWDDQGRITRCLKAASIRREADESLRRLRAEVIDLYQIHWPDPSADIEEAWHTLLQLKKEGKLRYIGVSNFNVQQMQRAQNIAPIATLQPPYSLLARGIEAQILPYAVEAQLGVISYSPMKSGLLSGKMTRKRVADFPKDDFRRASPEFQEPRLSGNLALAEILGEIGKNHRCSAGEVAIAWVLRNPAVTGAIVGVRSEGQVAGIVQGATFSLATEEIQRIEGFLEKLHPNLLERARDKLRRAFLH